MRTEHMAAIEDYLKDFAPSVALLRSLNRLVPEFIAVRQRLREASAELWNALTEESSRFAASLPDELSLAVAMKRFESELNANEELNRLLSVHMAGLRMISSAIGDPPNLVNLMLAEDVRIAIEETGLVESAVSAMTIPESRAPGTLTAEAHQVMDYGFYQVSETLTPYQLLELKRASAARSEFKSLEKSLRRAVTKQDPSWPVLSLVLVKVMGRTALEVAKWRNRSEETVRHDIGRANRMLNIKARPGKPKKGSLPIDIWDKMSFRAE